MTNSKGKKRQVNGKELNAALKTNDALFVDFLHRCLEWVPSFDLNAFKCNLKELAPKSALSAWGQRSLACACPVAGYIDHVIHRCVQFPFVLGSVSHFLPASRPPPRLCWFFSTDVFQCDGSLFLSFGVGAHGWVALFCQSWGHDFNLGAGCQ